MKRSMFAVFAALTLLLAAPVVAQQEEPDPELEAYESRTQPDADSITGGSGLTITGTVVEWNDEQLTLRTTTGVEHIQILPTTDHPVELTAGENVSVDYTRTSQGVMIAQKIRAEGTVTGTATDVATTELQTEDADLQAEADVDTSLDADTTMDEDFDADASLDTQADLESDLDTDADLQADADLDTTMDDEDTLPATGSDLPLVALLGLLSVAAAIGVRSYIR